MLLGEEDHKMDGLGYYTLDYLIKKKLLLKIFKLAGNGRKDDKNYEL
jgi:hypothetical protein